jgi:group I intron endonuclease
VGLPTNLTDKPCIYIIRCVVNQAFYIGRSSQPLVRWQTHLNRLKRNVHPNQHLQRVANKYGLDSLVCECLEEAPAELLPVIEQEFIDMFWEDPKFMNVSRSSLTACRFGWHHSPEVRAKIALTNTGWQPSEETRSLWSRQRKGRTLNSEWRQKIAEGVQSSNRILTESGREKISKSCSKLTKVVNVATGEEFVFPRRQDAASFVGCHVELVTASIKDPDRVSPKYPNYRFFNVKE